MASRKSQVLVAISAAVALAVTACSSPPSDLGRTTGNALTSYANEQGSNQEFEHRFGSGQLAYTASWIINPGPSGRTVPDKPYQYAEYVNDPDGTYRVQTPRHYAIQTVTDIFICATEGIVTCARAPRQVGAPNTSSVAITTLRRFSPEAIYEVSSDLALRVAEIREPTAWSSSRETHGDNTGVQCWEAVGPTSTAPLGFRACYTDDDARLMASLDLTGDGTLEVDLVTYYSGTDSAQFTAPSSFEDDERIYEQLVDLFPDVPLPPDPTPDPNATVDPAAEPAPTSVPTPVLPGAETPIEPDVVSEDVPAPETGSAPQTDSSSEIDQ